MKAYARSRRYVAFAFVLVVAVGLPTAAGSDGGPNGPYAPVSSDGSGGRANSVIPPDERVRVPSTRQSPFSATVFITFRMTLTGGTSSCSGFLIGPDTVATAAHCVAPAGGSNFYPPSTYRVSAGRNGTSFPYGTCSATNLAAPVGWFTSGTTTFDFAAIKLNCSVGNQAGWLPLSVRSDSLTGERLIVGGYPGEAPETQAIGTGRVASTSATIIYYDVDTTPGQSGAPAWQVTSACGGICVVAIHTSGNAPPAEPFNHGTRIIPQVAGFYAGV